MSIDSMLTFAQTQAAMKAMIDTAMLTPNEPVAIAIVDAAGNLEAYAKTGYLRLFGRRHAIRKAYTAALVGMDSGAHAQKWHSQGRSVSEMGDPNITFGQGGVVVLKNGVILGGIGVGGYPSAERDEKLARVGLEAMKL
ncbi:MAG: heme-binding protein [Burkholderiales bacterium]